MSTEQPVSSQNQSVQFETAEPIQPASAPAMACASCKQLMATEYYEVSGQLICPTCHSGIGAALASKGSKEHFILASVYGGGAAIVGALIWWGVRAATGYEIGLIAVAVGLLVGFAVRAGSQKRGGRRYQILAVLLTYLGITLNYVPDVVKGLGQKADESKSKAASSEDSAKKPNPPATEETGKAAARKNPPGVLAILAFIAIVIGIAGAAPFLSGFDNIMGLLIIGFALWEAWKVNRAVPLAISGPFRINAVPMAVASAPAAMPTTR